MLSAGDPDATWCTSEGQAGIRLLQLALGYVAEILESLHTLIYSEVNPMKVIIYAEEHYARIQPHFW